MRIIISHVYSADNKGDAALLGVLIAETNKQFPDADITILSMDNIAADEKFDGVRVKHSFMYYVNQQSARKPLWLLYGIGLMLWTLLWAQARRFRITLPMPKNWAQVAAMYREADLVIAVGGGYLRTKPAVGSMFDFSLLLHPIVLSSVLKTPTVLYSQSVGPLHRTIEKRMLAHVMQHDVALALIREDKSLALLTSLGVTDCVRSVDAGFLLKTDPDAASLIKLRVPKGRLIIGVTARKWLDAASQKAYEQAMAETLDYLIRKHKAYVIFIPQVTSTFLGDDDRLVSNAVLSVMAEKKHAIALDKNYAYQSIKAIYDQLDVLLGTRFHSVIFSLTSLVPALAIEYEHKTSGIMHDLGLDNWVVKMEDVSADRLKPLMDKLVAERSDYQAQLRKVLPAYIEKAHEAIELTAETYTRGSGA